MNAFLSQLLDNVVSLVETQLRLFEVDIRSALRRAIPAVVLGLLYLAVGTLVLVFAGITLALWLVQAAGWSLWAAMSLLTALLSGLLLAALLGHRGLLRFFARWYDHFTRQDPSTDA